MTDESQQALLVRVVSNPTSGAAKEQSSALRSAVGLLAERGWTVEWCQTKAPGHGQSLALEAARNGAHLVVAAGGDGTVHEVMNGIVGSDTALAVLPVGTANVLAAQLGLVGVPTPLHRPNLMACAEELLRGAPRNVDLGWAMPRGGEGRHFLLWAGVGLDAAVTHEIEHEARELKRLLGPAAFGALGLKRSAMASSGAEAILRWDGRRVRDRIFLAVIANIPLYAGTIRLAPEACLDDGLLNVAVFRGSNLLEAVQRYLGGDARSVMQHLSAVLTGRSNDSRPVSAPASHVRIIARQALPVHLDGEPFGTTPVTITVNRAALRLWVPRTAPDYLFSDSSAELESRESSATA